MGMIAGVAVPSAPREATGYRARVTSDTRATADALGLEHA